MSSRVETEKEQRLEHEDEEALGRLLLNMAERSIDEMRNVSDHLVAKGKEQMTIVLIVLGLFFTIASLVVEIQIRTLALAELVPLAIVGLLGFVTFLSLIKALIVSKTLWTSLAAFPIDPLSFSASIAELSSAEANGLLIATYGSVFARYKANTGDAKKRFDVAWDWIQYSVVLLAGFTATVIILKSQY